MSAIRPVNVSFNTGAPLPIAARMNGSFVRQTDIKGDKMLRDTRMAVAGRSRRAAKAKVCAGDIGYI